MNPVEFGLNMSLCCSLEFVSTSDVSLGNNTEVRRVIWLMDPGIGRNLCRHSLVNQNRVPKEAPRSAKQKQHPKKDMKIILLLNMFIL